MRSHLNKVIIILTDTLLFGLSYLFAYWLRFETFAVYEKYLFYRTIWWVMPVKMISAYYFKLYRGMWRYTSLSDLINIAKMAVFSLVVITSVLLFSYRFEGFSRSVYVIDCLITFISIAGIRVLIRLILGADNLFMRLFAPTKARKKTTRVIIYGAGNQGELILRTMLSNKSKEHEIVGFIDDDFSKKGRSIHGIKVLGDRNDVGHILKKYQISELLIAMHLTGEIVEEINAKCAENSARCRIVPGYSDLVTGDLHISNIRDIEISDLLSRAPVRIDYSAVRTAICGKRVLVTGAGGSIGGELVNQILEFSPVQLVLVDKCENYLFTIREEIDAKYNKTVKLHYHCSDITHLRKTEKLFSEYRPEMVFHAAANKHVPLMEVNKDEVLYNNVYGTKVVAELAEKYGATTFLLVSTDKVVNPKNTMGISKKLCEMFIQAISRQSNTSYITVRFGNVLGSNGSVIPIFTRQIKNGGPVTVTDPEVTRYFMTIPEAVLLILQSATMGKGGETFLLDMGEPVKIVELARRMIRLAKSDGDIQIKFTGMREGEKIHEELVGGDEFKTSTSHEKISMLKPKHSINSNTVNEINTLIKIIREGKEIEAIYNHATYIINNKFSNNAPPRLKVISGK